MVEIKTPEQETEQPLAAQKAALRDAVKQLQERPEVAKFEAQMREAKIKEEIAKDPGPIPTEKGLLSVEELIKHGRQFVKDCVISPSLHVDLRVLIDEEKPLINQLLKLVHPESDARIQNDEFRSEAYKRAWLAIAISNINGTEFPLVQGTDGNYDLTAKVKLYGFLCQFPISAIGLLWYKYYELEEENPFLNPTSKKKS